MVVVCFVHCGISSTWNRDLELCTWHIMVVHTCLLKKGRKGDRKGGKQGRIDRAGREEGKSMRVLVL